MFDTEPYRPYVALMRELRLEREWEAGDVFIDDRPERVLGGVRFHAEISEPQFHGQAVSWAEPAEAGEDSVWLPRLDQWLAMTNAPRVSFWRTDDGVVARAVLPGADEDDEPVTHREVGRTYEEAAARLWCAVTGRAVTAR